MFKHILIPVDGSETSMKAVAKAAVLAWPTGFDRASFEVVERVDGNATTDFGAPGMVGEGDRDPAHRWRDGGRYGLNLNVGSAAEPPTLR